MVTMNIKSIPAIINCDDSLMDKNTPLAPKNTVKTSFHGVLASLCLSLSISAISDGGKIPPSSWNHLTGMLLNQTTAPLPSSNAIITEITDLIIINT